METNTALSLLGYGILLGASIACLFLYLLFRKREVRLRLTLENEKAVIIAILESTNEELAKQNNLVRELVQNSEHKAMQTNALAEEKAKLETMIEIFEKKAEEKFNAVIETQESLRDTFRILSKMTINESNAAYFEKAELVIKSLEDDSVDDPDRRQKRIDEPGKPLRRAAPDN